MNATELRDVSLEQLRAWADAGEIPLGRYLDEVERRRKEREADVDRRRGLIAVDPGGCAPPVYVNV